jgi:hypothetical protein
MFASSINTLSSFYKYSFTGKILVEAANLSNNIKQATFTYLRQSTTITDTKGYGTWSFFASNVLGNDSITGSSSSTLWQDTKQLTYNTSNPNIPVAHYTFDINKTNGKTVYDEINGSQGIILANATIVNDNNYYDVSGVNPTYPVYGQGYLRMNGLANSYASLSPVYTGANGVSFSFWFRLNTLATANPYIFHLTDAATGNINPIELRVANATTLSFTANLSAGTQTITLPATIIDSVWRHYVISIDRVYGNTYVYQNGTIVGTTESTGQKYPLSMVRKYFTIGRQINAVTPGLDAGVGEFRVYNKYLTQLDATELYYSYSNINNSVLSFPMTPASYTANTIYDETGTKALTLNGGATFASTTGAVATSYVSLNAAAASQYISFPAFQSGAEGVTISTFFRSVSNSTNAVIFDLSGDIIGQIGTSGNFLLTVNGTAYQTAIAINNSVWNNIVCTFTYNWSGNGNAIWRIYLNGALSITYNSATAGSTYTYYPPILLRATNVFGKSAASNTNWFNGEIGDIRIYNRTLSMLDVQCLYYTITKDARLCHIPRANTLRYTLDVNKTLGTTSYEAVNSARTVTLSNSNMLINSVNPFGTRGYMDFANTYNATINTDISFGQTRAYSILMKKPVSNTHEVILNYGLPNSTSSYFILGTLNNIFYLTANGNNSGIAFGANGPTWQGVTNSLSNSNLSGFTGGDIALTADELTMVFTSGYSTSTAKGVYLSKYLRSPNVSYDSIGWSTPQQIGGTSFLYLQNVAMSCSAEIIVVTQRGGYVYTAIGNGTTYTTFTQTADTTSRTYTGLGMTANGSKIACSTNEGGTSGGILIANWNPSLNNYDAFTQVITNSTAGYNTLCLSIDGYKLAYSSGTTFYWATWNGSTYVQNGNTFSGPVDTTALNMKFTLDTNIIIMTTNNATSAFYFSNIITDGTNYNTFTILTNANIPKSANFTGLHYTPNNIMYISVDNSMVFYRNEAYFGERYRQHSFKKITDTNWHNYVYQTSGGAYAYTMFLDGAILPRYMSMGNQDNAYITVSMTQNYLGKGAFAPLSTFTGQLSDVRYYNAVLTTRELTDLSNSIFYREYNTAQLNTYDFSLCYNFLYKLVSGTTVYDTATYTAATIVGTASVIYARDVGGYLKVTDGYLQLPSIVVGANALCVSFWYFANNTGTLFEFADATPTNTYSINCRTDAKNTIYFAVKNNTTQYETQTYHNYSQNQFIHVAWNMFANGIWQIIINGETVKTFSGVYPNPTTYAYAYFGKNTSGSSNLNGGFTDIRIYNKTLSLEYVQQHLYNKHKNYTQYFTDISMSSGFLTQFLLNNTTTNTGTSGIVATLAGDNLPYLWYTLENSVNNVGTGENLNGTLFGSTSYSSTNKVYGFAALVTSTSSGINVPTLALNNAGGFTIAGWFYKSTSDNGTFFSLNNGEMSLTSVGTTFTFAYGINTVTAQITSINTWNHIVITLTDVSPVAKIYVNGVEQSTQSGFTYPTTTFTTNSMLSFNGSADDIRIYQRVLANYEVYNLFKSAYTSDTLKNTSSQYLSSMLGQDISLSAFTTPASGFTVSYWLKHEPSASHETIFSAARTVSGDYLTMGILNNSLFTTIGNTVPAPSFSNVTLSTGLVYVSSITVDTSLSIYDVVVSENGQRMIFTSGFLTTGNPYINFTSALGFTNGSLNTDFIWAPVKRITGVYRMMHMATTSDGNRLVVSQSSGTSPDTGYLFLTTWNEELDSYNELTQITNTQLDYKGIDITSDGNMLVYCSGNIIYTSYWNLLTNNYVIANQVVPSGLSSVINVGLSFDGSKIVYTDATTAYYAVWSNTLNNFDYTNKVTYTIPGTSSLRNIKFSNNARLFYVTKSGDATSVYYGVIGGATTMVGAGNGICAASQDTFGLSVDGYGRIYTCRTTSPILINRATATYASNYSHLYKYAAVPNNYWNHYMHTFETNGTITVYINGTTVNKITGSIYPTSISRANCFIGTDFHMSKSYYNGLISDFRIYGSVLTEANATPIYYGVLQGNGCKLLTYTNKTIDTNEVNYVLASTEIALKPSLKNAIYVVWTATANKSIKINTTFANYDVSTNGIGIQIFKINANNTFNTVLFSRTTTTSVLTNATTSNYLTIPVINTDVISGDKIYYRIDANDSTTGASAVLNVVIMT